MLQKVVEYRRKLGKRKNNTLEKKIKRRIEIEVEMKKERKERKKERMIGKTKGWETKRT